MDENLLREKFSNIEYFDIQVRGSEHINHGTDTKFHFDDVTLYVNNTEVNLDFNNYQTSHSGDNSTSNEGDLSVIYQGDWEFKDITSDTSSNLIWWTGQVEAY